jgi:hypothetical protein
MTRRHALPEELSDWHREQMAAWDRRFIRDCHEQCIRIWKERQRRERAWINFAAIADWCARMPGDVARDRTRHAQALLDLLDAVLAGEFDRAERCRVAYLPVGITDSSKPLRLRVRLDDLRRYRDLGEPSLVLAHCWAPRALCLRWFEARGIRPMPGLDRPVTEHPSQQLATEPEPVPSLASSVSDQEEAQAPADKVRPPKKKPPFDPRQAQALLIAQKASGVWREPPREEDGREFLLKHFKGVPNVPHRVVRHKVWPGLIRRGPKPKKKLAK